MIIQQIIWSLQNNIYIILVVVAATIITKKEGRKKLVLLVIHLFHLPAKLIQKWDPESITTFRTDEKQELAQGSSDYFLDSATRIHFFCEPGVVDENTDKIKEGIKKDEGLNKVGHGLHVANPVFTKYAQTPKVAAVARVLRLETACIATKHVYI